MKKLFIAAAVIVMAGSMASCGQKTQKAAQDTAATEPVATEQVETVEIEQLLLARGRTDSGAPPPFCTGTEFEFSGWERCGRFRYQLGKSDDYFAGSC